LEIGFINSLLLLPSKKFEGTKQIYADKFDFSKLLLLQKVNWNSLEQNRRQNEQHSKMKEGYSAMCLRSL
jgi:hypothetical protein